jgi:cell division protein FtsQ
MDDSDNDASPWERSGMIIENARDGEPTSNNRLERCASFFLRRPSKHELVKARRIRLAKSRRPRRMEAKKFAASMSTGILIVGAIAALIMIANRWDRREDLRSIRIVGRHVLDSAEIIPPGLIPDSLPLRSLDLAAIEKGVAAHPFIESASVYRGENGTLVVEVAERAPVAATVIDGNVAYIDSLAALLPGRFGVLDVDVPIVSGIGPHVLQGRMTLNKAWALEMLGVMKTIRGYSVPLFQQISEIHRSETGEYELIMADAGVPVLIGKPDNLPDQLARLDRFLTTVGAEKGMEAFKTIDVRWRGEVVVRGSRE